MEETDLEIDVEVETEPDETEEVIVSAEELRRGLKEMFGDSALTTRVEDKGNRIVVNGDGWQFFFRSDGKLVFRPDGSTYRLVRSVDELESVGREVEDDEEAVSFVFPGEKITFRRGVEHHA